MNLRVCGLRLGGAVLAITASACSPTLSQFAGRERTEAPQAANETGVLVRGVGEADVIRLLKNQPDARFRQLNSAHGMYEIYHLPAAVVQAELPMAKVSRNVFFPSEEESPREALSAWAETNSKSALAKCEKGVNPPQALIEVENLSNEVEARRLELGSQLVVNGAKSASSLKQKLRMAWVILAPEGAVEEERVVTGPVLKVTVDSLGAWGVGLVVQDERNVCNIDLIEFAVTTNREYLGPNRSPAGADVDLNSLSHLSRLKTQRSWKVSTGQGQLIAVIDSGVNFNHRLLRDNIWVNQREVAGNGVDDDGNGFVDDLVGWDFSFGDNSPFDDVGHGSHVAGLAASPVFGLAKGAKILSLKALGAFGGDGGSIAAAIRYAVDSGARVINLSLGSYAQPQEELLDAITYAEQKGALLVAAAGNGHPSTGIGVDTDVMPFFPSALDNANILSVAALGEEERLAIYSNYGARTVDIAAPGGEEGAPLKSTFLDNPRGLEWADKYGTSMASPIVAGLAAQVWSRYPTLTALEVKKRILTRGRTTESLRPALASGRQIDPLATLAN